MPENLTTHLPWPVNQFDHLSEFLGEAMVLAMGWLFVMLRKVRNIMMEKIQMRGVPETMLQTLYARAAYSKKSNAKFRDQLSVQQAGHSKVFSDWF